MMLPPGMSAVQFAASIGVPPDCVQIVTEVPRSVVASLGLHYETVVIPLTVDQEVELATQDAVLLNLPALPAWNVRVPPPWALFATIRVDRTVPDAQLFARQFLLIFEEPSAPAAGT